MEETSKWLRGFREENWRQDVVISDTGMVGGGRI